MFRPVRLLVLVVLAFLAGIMTERYNLSERCAALGGTMADVFCERDDG